MILPGKFKYKVIISSFTSTSNSMGVVTETAIEERNTWAEIVDNSVNETYQESHQEDQNRISFRTRYFQLDHVKLQAVFLNGIFKNKVLSVDSFEEEPHTRTLLFQARLT